MPQFPQWGCPAEELRHGRWEERRARDLRRLEQDRPPSWKMEGPQRLPWQQLWPGWRVTGSWHIPGSLLGALLWGDSVLGGYVPLAFTTPPHPSKLQPQPTMYTGACVEPDPHSLCTPTPSRRPAPVFCISASGLGTQTLGPKALELWSTPLSPADPSVRSTLRLPGASPIPCCRPGPADLVTPLLEHRSLPPRLPPSSADRLAPVFTPLPLQSVAPPGRGLGVPVLGSPGT